MSDQNTNLLTEPSTREPSVTAEKTSASESKSPLLWFLAGGIMCIAFGVADIFILEFANSARWSDGITSFTFAFFITQTFVISSFVGQRLKESRQAARDKMVIGWFFFFGWSLVFTNIFLLWAMMSGDNYRAQGMRITFVFAFFCAQIGLALCWLMLGELNWKKRIPIAGVVLFLACFPIWRENGLVIGRRAQSWDFVLIVNTIAVFVTCCIMRVFRFGFTTRVDSTGDNQNSKKIHGQFSIRHLFVWTTVVAVMFAIGRLIPWSNLWNRFALDPDFQLLGLLAILITLLIVLSLWGSLGFCRPHWLKIPIVTFMLVALTVSLFWSDYSFAPARNCTLAGSWGIPQWQWDEAGQVFLTWAAFAALNSLFLMSMLRVFQVPGTILARREKQKLVGIYASEKVSPETQGLDQQHG